MQVIVSQHESLAAMVDSVLAIPAQRRAKANKSIQDWDFIGRMFGDLPEAAAAIHQDWTEGLEMIDSLRRELESLILPQAKSFRRRRCWSADNGDSVDNDRLRAGQDYWASMTRVDSDSPKLVDLHVGLSAPAKLSPRNLLWRGAAALVLTEWLQNHGFRVRITAYSLCKDVYNMVEENLGLVTCVLKEHSDPLNIAALVNGLSGWCYRTTWFASKAHGDLPYNSSLGRPTEPSAEIEARYFPNSIRCDRFYSREDAEAWLKNAAESFAA